MEENLALKIVSFFRLYDEQLKYQGYYDSVLKAPRSVLTVSNRECDRSKQVKAEMTDDG